MYAHILRLSLNILFIKQKAAYFNQNSNENFHRIVSVEVEGLFLIDQSPATYFSFMKFSLVS